ncbi:polysaccharide deacetylase family sporulation protein PdaB [Caldanaerobacter sp.]|uniref:polysaccharide deacetylase family sporulation protein PdaB n=1 Tax=Caldanaerobacter sp. TaxID=2930036 RepID=UPI003C70E243
MHIKSFAIIVLISILAGSAAFAYKYITEDRYLTELYSSKQNPISHDTNSEKGYENQIENKGEEKTFEENFPQQLPYIETIENQNLPQPEIIKLVDRPERDKLFAPPIPFNKKTLGSKPSSGKEIALTFDDGPFPFYTERYVDLLKSMDVKATFFVIGKHAEKHPELLKYILENGNEIGLHSYSHLNMKKLKPEKIVEELYKNQQIVVEATGIKPTLFRPPFGAYNFTLIEISNALGLKVVLWNVDPDDWRNPSVENVVNRVLSHTKDGAIILLHEGKPNTLAALPQIIKDLKEKGYKFVTVSELLEKRD